jgi:hypothetical protein
MYIIPIMEQQQTSQVPTPVSFDDISLVNLSFNESFRVTRGSASQVVLGLRNMLQKLSNPENDYQRSIYPQLVTSINRLVDSYISTFLLVTDATERQVFGANLNGFRNDGSLYRSVNSGINRSLTYGYSQFGQLVRVLVNRLKFIVKRDPQSVERYKNSESEMTAYKKLQQASDAYLSVVNEVMDSWSKTVDESRKTHGVQRENTNARQSTRQTTNNSNNNWTTVQRSSHRVQTVNPSHGGGRGDSRGGRGGGRGGGRSDRGDSSHVRHYTNTNTNTTRSQQVRQVNSF